MFWEAFFRRVAANDMTQRLRQIWDLLHSSYWFVPTLMAVAAVCLSVICLSIDESQRYKYLRDSGWVYAGGPEGARAVLSTVAGSIITVAGTTFSITIAALSLASSQFGPRLLRNFMRDTGNQVVLGTFTSTFLYCLLVLRTVRGLDDDTYVPHVSVTVSVILAALSVGVLIYFVHHVAETIQVSHVIDRVSQELNETVARLFPDHAGESFVPSELPDMTTSTVIASEVEGYVQSIDLDSLVSLGADADIVISLKVRPGDYLVLGHPLADVAPPADARRRSAIRSAVATGRVRTSYQDSVFAFLQLVEVAVRALSPGINDPFTAIICIDRISSAMRRVARRSPPEPQRCDSSGTVRVIARAYSYEELTEAAFRHIRESATNQWQVKRQLRTAILRVLEVSMDPRLRAALIQELEATG